MDLFITCLYVCALRIHCTSEAFADNQSVLVADVLHIVVVKVFPLPPGFIFSTV